MDNLWHDNIFKHKFNLNMDCSRTWRKYPEQVHYVNEIWISMAILLSVLLKNVLWFPFCAQYISGFPFSRQYFLLFSLPTAVLLLISVLQSIFFVIACLLAILLAITTCWNTPAPLLWNWASDIEELNLSKGVSNDPEVEQYLLHSFTKRIGRLVIFKIPFSRPFL